MWLVRTHDDRGAGDTGGAGGSSNPKGAEESGGTGGAKEPTVEERLKAMETDLAKATETNKELASKLGKTEEAVKGARDFTAALKDPKQAKTLIENIAKVHGTVLTFGDDPTKTLLEQIVSGDQKEVAKGLTAISKQASEQARNEIKPLVDTILEERLASRYPDYDDLADSRSTTQALRLAGKLSDQEYDHLAARGLNMADALKKAGELAVAEYVKTLQEKNEGHIPGGGAGGGKLPAGEAVATLKSILPKLQGT